MTYNWPLATYEWLVPGKLRGALERLLLAEVVSKRGGCLNEEVSYTEATGFFGAAA